MKERLVQLKVFAQRAMSYMTVISAGSLLFLVSDALQNYGFTYSVVWLTPILFLLSVLFCLFLGWIDLKSGVYAEELKYGFKNSPPLVEIQERLKRIEEKLK